LLARLPVAVVADRVAEAEEDGQRHPISVKGGIDRADAAWALIHQSRLSTLATETASTSSRRVAM
jgi:hypothetical protein